MRRALALALLLMLPVSGCAAIVEFLERQQEKNAIEAPVDPGLDGVEGPADDPPKPPPKPGPIVSDDTIAAAGALANTLGAGGLGGPIAGTIGFAINLLGSALVGKV